MKKKITIAIDAMGGDNSPDKTIQGVFFFLKKNSTNNDFLLNLYGDEIEIKKKLKKYNISSNLELCIRYVNSLNFLNYIVFGIENFGQIKKIIKYKNKKFSNRVTRKINQMFEFLDTRYVDILKL